MKMSEKRQTDLYRAISDPIMDLRIIALRSGGNNSWDDRLIRLQGDIWVNIKQELGIKEKKGK